LGIPATISSGFNDKKKEYHGIKWENNVGTAKINI
jgi:hypothetical protein